VLNLIAWLLRPHVMPVGIDITRMFTAIGGALFDAALMWLTYLGLEPYVRRYSPDSLIGWTRLTAGRWNDSRVGADVMIGVSAGLAMTVLFAVHNVIPPLMGRPEPMPFTSDATLLGTMSFDGVDVQPLPFSSNTANLDLTAFLNADNDGLVTFLFMSVSEDGHEYRIDSKEGSTSGGHGPMTLNFVPEPASLLLIGLGLLGVAFSARRRW